MKKSIIILIPLGITLFFLFNSSLLLIDPPIWPDESIFADIALNYLKKGTFATELWQGLIPFVSSHALWYPPVFFFTLAGWFKLFGFSLVGQRLLSLVMSSSFLLVFFFYSRHFFRKKNSHLAVLPTLFLIFDFTFLRSTRINRPEILLNLLGICSLYFFQLTINKQKPKKLVFLALSGLFSSLAFLTHFLGIYFLLINLLLFFLSRKHTRSLLELISYLFSFLFPVLLWFARIFPHFYILKKQVLLAFFRKTSDPIWLFSVFTTQPLVLKLIYLGYILLALFSLITLAQTKKYTLLLSLIFSLLVSIFGKQFWYFSLLLPHLYLASIVSLTKLKNQLLSPLIITTLLITTATNLLFSGKILASSAQYNYRQFGESILKKIPDQTTVLLSSIPDPYYAFQEKNRQNRLLEFPPLEISAEDYLSVLHQTDYVIYNGNYSVYTLQDFFLRYLKLNQEQTVQVGSKFGYKTNIIKLKPRSQRASPEMNK